MPETAIDEGTRLKILEILKKPEPDSKEFDPGPPGRPAEIDLKKICWHGARRLAPGKRVFVVFNHARTGALCSQYFENIWERESPNSDVWNLVEPAEEKIAAHKMSAHVINLFVIEDAKSHAEALEIAKNKFGSKTIKKEEAKS